MSASYTLHVAPYAAPGDPNALERADLVRDGFSWGAFLVPALWFLRHRHWWLALGAALAVPALWGALHLLGARPPAILAAEILLHLLLGFEGPSLRAWAYDRAHRPAVDVVTAASEAEAEAKSFGRWLDPAGAPAARPAARLAPGARDADHILGLFPDREGRA